MKAAPRMLLRYGAWLVPAAFAVCFGLSRPLPPEETPFVGVQRRIAATAPDLAQSDEQPVLLPSGDATQTREPDEKRMFLFRAALEETEALHRRQAWRRALAAAGPGELEAAARLLTSADDPPRMGEWLPELLLQRWQSVDPAGLLRFVREHPDTGLEDQSFQRMAGKSLVRQNPAALKEMLQRDPAEKPDNVLEGVVAGMALSDLEQAAEWVLSRPAVADRPMMKTLASGVCHSLGTEGADRLLAFLRRKGTHASEMEEAMRHSLTTLATMPNPDPAATAAWLRRRQTQPEWPADGTRLFFQSMKDGNQAGIMELAEAMGPDPAGGGWAHAGEAMSALAETWAFPAVAWLRSHADSPFYDEAALAWTKHISASLEFTDVYVIRQDGVAELHAHMKDPGLRTAAQTAYAAARAEKKNGK